MKNVKYAVNLHYCCRSERLMTLGLMQNEKPLIEICSFLNDKFIRSEHLADKGLKTKIKLLIN